MILLPIGLVVLIFLSIVYLFNSFVNLSNKVKSAWSDIEVQLKKRYELVPQLAKTVKAYARYEKTTLETVTTIRIQAMKTENIMEKSAQEQLLSGAIKSLFAVVEKYPMLKSDTHFLSLQNELIAIEESIEMARRYYNGSVREFNSAINRFPNLLLARVLKYKNRSFFVIDKACERDNNKILL